MTSVRLKLDEPTGLPEGQLIELVPLDEVFLNGGDDLDQEERAALHERGRLRPMFSWMSSKGSLNRPGSR